MPSKRLSVFLCHSSQDKPAVRELYDRLLAEGWVDPWLDEKKLLPGQDWDLAIEKAVENSHAVIVCVSNSSVTKEGYIQKELRFVLDIALTKPEEEIFVIPLRLEDCQPPRRLRVFHYVDYFPKSQQNAAYQFILQSLKRRAESLQIEVMDAETRARQQTDERARKELQERIQQEARDKVWREMEERLRIEAEERARKEFEVGRASSPTETIAPKQSHAVSVTYETPPNKITLPNGMEFMRVPKGKFIMGSNDSDSEKPQHTVDLPYDYWMGRFPVTNMQYSQFQKKDFAKDEENNPVVYVKWTDAQSYVKWLNEKLASQLPKDYVLHLPSEAEWEKAARGESGLIYPWGNQFDQNKCNSSAGGKKDTTPVGLYSPQGDSPYGCADMAGNVWEWTRSLYKPYPYVAKDGREDEKSSDYRILRGGSFSDGSNYARCSFRFGFDPYDWFGSYGFRVVLSPILPS